MEVVPGVYGVDFGGRVWSYIVEGGDGLTLIEIAPGIDLQKDVLDMMEFKPVIDPKLREIDLQIYAEGLMNLGNDL